jgi:sulfite reductase (ferredoxin)
MSKQIRTEDLRGEVCPYVFLKSRLAMKELPAGESLRVITDFPPAVDDLNKGFTIQGDEVLRVESVAGGVSASPVWAMTIRKGTYSAETNGAFAPEIKQDIEDFQNNLLAYFRNELEPAAFKRFRLVRGIYGQRQPGLQMVRVKIPYGRLTSAQLRVCGEVAATFGCGLGHVTTRQDIQFHFVPLPRVPAFLRAIGAVGLTTREACGNTVRNVTACLLAGVCPHEAFDVTPYAAAVSRYFLRHPLAQALPRKFKIAFSGCAADCAMGGINDIGLTAIRNPQSDIGFRMVVGGGLGPSPEVAHLLYEFVRVDELIPTCEAIIRVFDREGNRNSRNTARLKFVIRRLGITQFREEVEKGRVHLGNWEAQKLGNEFREDAPAVKDIPDVAPSNTTKCLRWLAQNVAPQRQEGYAIVTLHLPRGDITSEQFAALADVADQFSDSSVRTTHQQNIVLRWIRQEHLPALFNALDAIELAEPIAQTIVDVVSCPGADSCRLGITKSRGVAAALMDALQHEAHAEDLKGVTIKASGCPNACGQHWIATIGLHGAAMKAAGGKQIPAYQLMLGGAIGQGETRLGKPIARVPARRVPEAVRRLIALYRSEKQADEDFPTFAARVDVQRVRGLVADLQTPIPTDAEPLFVDFGDAQDFKVETGEGECAI